jgi:F-type H+-transporting ATPase subunit a
MSINILQKREISENILEERGKEIEKEIGRSEQNKEKLNTSEVIKDPLEQFEIRDLISLDLPIIDNIHISLTNIALYLVISVILLSVIMINSNNLKKIKSNFWSLWQESLYDIIYNLVINQINLKKGEIFFPFIYSIFMFILINNLISMIPYSFATTSHFILTFFISFTIVLGATIVGFNKHGLKFFSLFVPAGCPLALLPVLVLIEFISYLTRNISLGLRLAANIFSGHMLLNILSGFTYNIMTSGFLFFFFSLLPLSFIIAFSGLELGIAFIQSQVFVVLSCSYIKDALELH